MSSVDDLFARYRTAFTAGEGTDPRPYLEQVSGTDRRELAALIDAFLERASPPPFDPARARANPLTSRVVSNLMADVETWRTLLPAAEAKAGLSRAELVDRLARALGVADKREKVHLRYHEMEHGQLPPERVRPKVLEALASILDVSVERLRAAGLRMSPPPPQASAPVFARSRSVPLPAAAAPPPQARQEEPWDEVDDLFKGG